MSNDEVHFWIILIELLFQFSQEEVNVNEDIISLVHSQVAELKNDMQPNLQDIQQMTILTEKDHQIVKLESQIREKGKVIELL